MVEWVWFTSIGLALDILGVIIMVSPYFRVILFIIGGTGASAVLRREVKPEKIRIRMIIGLLFLLAGFILQIMGTWIQYYTTFS